MTGLFLFAVVAAGLGQFLPKIALAGTPLVGLRFFGGFITLILGFVALHVVLQIPLAVTAWGLVFAAVGGLVRGVVKLSRARGFDESILLHPIPVFLLIGFVSVLANGGIGYLPYTSDEFTNWLGASRHIFLAEGYGEIRESIHLPEYTPGWRLTLLFPWLIVDSIREGDSAAAPFILSVGLAGIVYDIVLFALRRLRGLSELRSALFAWAIFLAGVAAEIYGLVWPRDLLIEPPQIFTLAAALLVVAAMSAEKSHAKQLAIYVGLALAGSYFIKSAALAFAPAVGIWVLFLARWDGQSALEYARRAASFAIPLVGPLFIAATVWKIFGPTVSGGMPSILATFQEDYLSRAFVNDWWDLARRFLGAVWTYGAGYKTPMTIGALCALLIAGLRGRPAALLIWFGFAGLYTLALYWYHLVAFGDYYFRELNSIPRFMRVPIQVLHVVGFVVAVLELSDLFWRARLFRLVASVQGKTAGISICAAIAVLFIFQGVQIHRSVVDVTTRKYQSIDPRINEVKTAVQILANMAGRELPENPMLMLISQGGDSEPLSYARYFGRGIANQNTAEFWFRLVSSVSWTSAAPKNVWQHKTTAEALRKTLTEADLIWPLKLDPWVTAVLAHVVDLRKCAKDISQSYFVRRKEIPRAGLMICRPKPGV